ncbi:MAG: hypothetical protein ABDH21_06365 [bacterium]
MKLIYTFGTDGIREKHPFLNEIIAYLVGKSFCKAINKKNKVVIGYDTRFNSYSMALAIASALVSEGFKVELSRDYISTPALAFITKYYNCYGFQITASHNPYNYNGIKILFKGLKIDEKLEKEIELTLNSYLDSIHEDFSNYLNLFQKPTNSNNNFKISDLLKIYIDKILVYIKNYLDNLKKYTIILDLSNGALSKYAPVIYRKLGAKVITLNNKPDGFNINQNCGSTNIESFKKQFIKLSKNYNNPIGLSFDGDGDRVIAIYKHNGQIITLDGDTILLIISKYLKNELKMSIKSVALTHMSSLGIEKAFQEEGIKVIRTDVGDKYLTKQILENGVDMGAEQSGHIIIPPFLYTGDGILSSLFLLTSLKKIDPYPIIQNLQKYQQKLINIPVTDKKKFINQNNDLFRKISQNFPDVRIFVRPSGTEEVVRILIESQDQQKIIQVQNIINQEVRT